MEKITIDNTFTPLVHNPDNVLEVNALKKYFPIKEGMLQRTVGYVRAVDGISFNIKRGTTMGLVGESGCGKTTVGRTILRLHEKSGGEVLFNGQEVHTLSRAQMRALRPKMQIIFQDPYSSLSPRLPIGEIVGEAVREHNIVPKEEFNDYIDEFVVCDEPVSALDVSIQAQIINLLRDLQEEHNLTYLFISHDLSVVEHISDTIGVMYLGSLVEFGSKEDIFREPLHPYTKALFSAIPIPDPNSKMNRIVLEGSIPSPANPPKGCKFHTRCKNCMEKCKTEAPQPKEIEPGHFVVCHLYDNEPENKAE